jgi:hypothetical protein
MLHAHATLMSMTVLVCMINTEHKRSTPINMHMHMHKHTQSNTLTQEHTHTPARLLEFKSTTVTTVNDVAVTPNQLFRSLAVSQPVLSVHETPLVES